MSVQWAWLALLVMAALVIYLLAVTSIGRWIDRAEPRFIDRCPKCGHPRVEHEPLSVEIEGTRLHQCQTCGEACLL